MARRGRPIVNVARVRLRSIQYSSRPRSCQGLPMQIFTVETFTSAPRGRTQSDGGGEPNGMGGEPNRMKGRTEWDEGANPIGCSHPWKPYQTGVPARLKLLSY